MHRERADNPRGNSSKNSRRGTWRYPDYKRRVGNSAGAARWEHPGLYHRLLNRNEYADIIRRL